MRILHSTATLSAAQGGPSRAVIDMALAARERGHEVAVFATTYKDPPIDLTEAQQRGVTFHRYPLGRPELLNRPLQRSPALAAALARTLAAGAYDLVHLHSLHLHHCWVTGLICQRLGLPYLLRPHGSFDPYIIRKKRPAKWLLEQLFMNRVIRGAAALHFTAQEEWSLARPWIFNRPGVVVPNSLDCQAYQDLPDRSVFLDKYPEAKGRRIVLFLSRLAAKKGLDLLVPAFAAAQQRFGDLHLVLAGPDHGIAKQVEADLQTHNLRERASITGMIQGAEKLSGGQLFRPAQLQRELWHCGGRGAGGGPPGGDFRQGQHLAGDSGRPRRACLPLQRAVADRKPHHPARRPGGCGAVGARRTGHRPPAL